MNFAQNNAQGAIEYLLLLAAAIVVVAIVVSFLSSTIGPVQSTGDEKNYGYLCNTLDSNTAQCSCYNGNSKHYYKDATTAKAYCCTVQTSSYLKQKWSELNPLNACS